MKIKNLFWKDALVLECNLFRILGALMITPFILLGLAFVSIMGYAIFVEFSDIVIQAGIFHAIKDTLISILIVIGFFVSITLMISFGIGLSSIETKEESK